MVEIRKAKLSDLEEIFKLQKIWEKEKINYGIYLHPDVKKEIVKELKKDIFFVSQEDQILSGFIHGEIIKAEKMKPSFGIKKGEKYGEIHSVYVLRKFRDKGTGKRLIDRLFEELKSKKIKKILLKATGKDVWRLVNYYKKLGFEERHIDMFLELD